MAVTHLPRHGGAHAETTIRAADTITAQLVDAGFRRAPPGALELDPVPAGCVLVRVRAKIAGGAGPVG